MGVVPSASMFCLPMLQASSFSLPLLNVALCANKIFYWILTNGRTHDKWHQSIQKRQSTSPWLCFCFGVKRIYPCPITWHTILTWDSYHLHVVSLKDLDWLSIFVHLSATMEQIWQTQYTLSFSIKIIWRELLLLLSPIHKQFSCTLQFSLSTSTSRCWWLPRFFVTSNSCSAWLKVLIPPTMLHTAHTFFPISFLQYLSFCKYLPQSYANAQLFENVYIGIL